MEPGRWPEEQDVRVREVKNQHIHDDAFRTKRASEKQRQFNFFRSSAIFDGDLEDIKQWFPKSLHRIVKPPSSNPSAVMDLLQKLLQTRTQQIKQMQRHQKPSEVKPIGQTTFVKVECPPAPPVPLGPEDVWERLQEGETVKVVRNRPSCQSVMELTLEPEKDRLRIRRTRWRGQMFRSGGGSGTINTTMTDHQTTEMYVRAPRSPREIDGIISRSW